MRSCLKVLTWVVIFALAAQFFTAAPWLILVFAALVGGGILFSRARKAALESDTLKIVGEEPLGNILDANRAMTAASAKQLLGDESFSFEVVGESFYAQNFSTLQKNVGLVDGQDWDDVAVLIVDPGNLHSKTAVAVFVSGLKLGYVPEQNAPGVFRFLMQSGGFAKADAAIYFSSGDGKNSLWLDVVLPVMYKP